jgi:hypothetical protein
VASLIFFRDSLPALYLAMVLFGFGWFTTAPLAAGLVADLFGFLRIGTVIGKLDSPQEEVLALRDNLQRSKIGVNPASLGQDWDRIKSVVPTCSGGLHPALERHHPGEGLAAMGIPSPHPTCDRRAGHSQLKGNAFIDTNLREPWIERTWVW